MSTISLRLLSLSSVVAALALGSLAGYRASTPQNVQMNGGLVPASSPRPAGSLLSPDGNAFVENRGQWDAQAQYLARTPGVDVWITDRGAVYDFYRAEKAPPMDIRREGPGQTKRRGQVVKMEFVGATGSLARGTEAKEGTYNYLVGNDKSSWATGVRRFGEVRAERLYDGVEARYYFDQGAPRYDLILAPGTDASKIRMRFQGANSVKPDGKNLLLETSLGTVEHRGLFAYQKINGATVQVPCEFRASGNTISFALGDYDRTKPLVIDPLIWSTYLGSGGHDYAYDVKLTPTGQSIVVGDAGTSSFPVTVGAYDTTNSNAEAFVAKLTKDGSGLLFATFYGGSGYDYANSVELDSEGRIHICGITLSTDLAVSPSAFDSTYNGGQDSYAATLSPDGAALVMGNYIGSDLWDVANDIAVDSLDRPIVVGTTQGASFPTTAGAFRTTKVGIYEGYVLRFSADGTALQFSTLLGGSGDTGVRSVVLDGNNRPLVTGYTNASDFATTGGAYDVTQNGYYDAFVTRLSANGSSLLASTFLGGNTWDTAFGIAYDSAGKCLVVGSTQSSNFPTSANGFQKVFGGLYDVFVTRLNSSLTTLEAGTFIGGDQVDYAQSVGPDIHGNVIIAGYAGANFPTTAGAFDETHNGSYDAIVCKLSNDLSQLRYSTYVGAAGDERAFGLAVDPSDPSGNTVFVGQSNFGFPTTAGAYDQTHNGGYDAFIAKVATAPAVRKLEFPGSKVVGGFVAQLTITLTQPAETTVLVNLSTSHPGKFFAPATTKIKPGQVSKTFGVRTETVLSDLPITVTGTYNGGTFTANLTLIRGGLQSLKLTGTTIQQESTGSGTVNLSGPAQQNRTVSLSSSNMSALNPGTSVMVPQNATSANFSLTSGTVASSTNVTISGTLGAMTRTDTMTVNP